MRTRSFSQRKRARLACSMRVDGPIAQLVEQLAFNQWVAGSSPARLNSPFKLKELAKISYPVEVDLETIFLRTHNRRS
jgi:hypothetical protein